MKSPTEEKPKTNWYKIKLLPLLVVQTAAMTIMTSSLIFAFAKAGYVIPEATTTICQIAVMGYAVVSALFYAYEIILPGLGIIKQKETRQ